MLIGLAGLFCVLVNSCHTLPPPVAPVPSPIRPAPTSGALVEVAAKVRARIGPSRSGLLSVPGNREALDYRLALIDSARSTLDIRIFFWMKDLTGRVLLERVLQAADRGVRVRLLLDDLVLGLTFTDKELAMIHTHPCVEVRIYNPFFVRGRLPAHVLEMMIKPAETNQRMHNKSIIADQSLAIISGRNVGDHCFGLGRRYNLIDLGVMVSGPVVGEICAGFDRYWESEPSYDVAAFYPHRTDLGLDPWRAKSKAQIIRKNRKLGNRIPIGKQDWSHVLTKLASRMHAGHARFVEDAPEVPSPSRPVIDASLRLAAMARKDLILVTPYIVPDQRMMDLIAKVRMRGVRVRLLLPSIGSNNHLVVHNQYQKYRKMLLRRGVEIYEFKHRPGQSALRYLNEATRPARKVGLHSKAVVVDTRFCYIGSLNFDGRAMFVNTEEGLIIDSPSLVRDLRHDVETLMQPENTWRLTLSRQGDYLWTSAGKVRKREPTLSLFQSVLESVLRPFSLCSAIFPDQQLFLGFDPSHRDAM
ncbi:MAG: phospholipase D family protein [Verrucomicrobiae bacterium]|nr:phospholipase D family protein [Verrucomicrobiae bacterium]NNJ43630.1 phospholipase D family protein [Akkermansiaceae bacterium]